MLAVKSIKKAREIRRQAQAREAKRREREELLLNDNLVDLYLKYLSSPPQPLCTELMPRLDETSRLRVHVFSAFFLKKLQDTELEAIARGEGGATTPADKRKASRKAVLAATVWAFFRPHTDGYQRIRERVTVWRRPCARPPRWRGRFWQTRSAATTPHSKKWPRSSTQSSGANTISSCQRPQGCASAPRGKRSNAGSWPGRAAKRGRPLPGGSDTVPCAPRTALTVAQAAKKAAVQLLTDRR